MNRMGPAIAVVMAVSVTAQMMRITRSTLTRRPSEVARSSPSARMCSFLVNSAVTVAASMSATSAGVACCHRVLSRVPAAHIDPVVAVAVSVL